MNYKDILLRAWTIIHNYEFLAWMNFVPVLLALIFNTFFLSYQWYSTYYSIFGSDTLFHENMRIVEILFKDLQIGWGLVILISIIFIIRLYLPQFIDGAVISQIFKKEKGEEPNIGDSIGSGLYHSWGIIKINALLEVFQLSTVMTAWLFIFRSNDDLLWIVTPVCVVIGSIGLILHYFSLFAKPILIEKGVSVMEALAQSTKLTLLNIKHSFILFFFILFISARLFFNVFIILALPIIISFLISYLAIKLSIVATLIITGVISVLFLYFIVRFFASIDVLFLSVWVMLYKEIENKNV